MSLETYKQINEELIEKVQELKVISNSLEKELIAAKRRLFEEHQKRIESEMESRRIINSIKRKMNRILENAIREFNYDENSTETPTRKPRNIMRRSSTGVTMRSPLRSNSSQQIVRKSEQLQHIPAEDITEEAVNVENNCSATLKVQNMWGLDNITENSGNKNPSSVENTESEPQLSVENTESEPQLSSCQSIDTIINNGNAVEVGSESHTSAIPSILLNNRRTTQIWQHCPIGKPTASTANINPNIESNSITMDNLTVIVSPDMGTMQRLTQDFSENLVLHSTPRSSQIISPSTENSQFIRTNQTDENSTLMTSSSRPRRQCAPKNLVEPSISKKLRNEEKVANKHQTKKKKGTK